MPILKRKFQKGIRLKNNTDASLIDGEIRNDGANKRIKVFHDTDGVDAAGEYEVVSTEQTQTLQNKSLDADDNTITNIDTTNLRSGVLVTDISLATSDTELPSALAVKSALAGQNEASEITVDDSGFQQISGPSLQDAMASADGYIDTLLSDTSTVIGDLSNHLSDTLDAHDASAISTVALGNLVATDVQSALNELQGDIDTRALATSGTLTSSSIVTPVRLDVKQNTEANLITYALTASNGQLCFATDSKKMFQVIDTELEPVGGGGSTSFEIDQTTHGFSLGDGIYHNGSSWVKGKADDVDTLAYFTVIEVVSVNKFIAADFGRIEAISHGFTVGQYYFLSEATAGLPTVTEPSTGFSNPLFYVEDANTLQIKVYKPTAVDGGIELDHLLDVSAPSPVDGQVLTWVNANNRYEVKYAVPQSVTSPILNNQAAVVDVSGLLLDNSSHRSFDINYSVYRTSSSSELIQSGKLQVSYKAIADTFSMSDIFSGDNAGVTFSITTAGQIQYISTNIAGTGYTGDIIFKIVEQL